MLGDWWLVNNCIIDCLSHMPAELKYEGCPWNSISNSEFFSTPLLFQNSWTILSTFVSYILGTLSWVRSISFYRWKIRYIPGYAYTVPFDFCCWHSVKILIGSFHVDAIGYLYYALRSHYTSAHIHNWQLRRMFNLY